MSSAIYMLESGKYKVKTISLTKEPITLIGGLHVIPDYDMESIPAEYEAGANFSWL